MRFGAIVGEGCGAPLHDSEGDFDTVAVPLVSIEIPNCSSSLSGVGHEDKAASASQMVKGCEYNGMLDSTELGKKSLELIGGSIERKVEDVQIALRALATRLHTAGSRWADWEREAGGDAVQKYP